MSAELPLFLAMVGGYAFGAAGALVSATARSARRLSAAGAIIGAGASVALAATVMAGGGPWDLSVRALLGVGGGLAFRLDALGALFVGLVGLVAGPAAVYSVGYCEAYETRYSLRLLGAMFNLFLLTMSLVPCADNVLTFLLMWEGMSLTSYFLVLTESDNPETISAGNWYLAMTHVGLALILAAFLLLAGAGATGFADLRARASSLPAETRNAVFVLALLGFGSKAGIIPLHVWLPRAHPAAPSHVSALMSGVMIKMGVYGLLRATLDLVPGGPPWWGGLVLVVGALSALLGVLYALVEHDLKRLLAYHSVENVGIILIGIGGGLLLQSYGLPGAAALGVIGGLYHTINHACFKGLLFLGAGSVLHATHTRNMEELGGLITRMPRTGAFFLIGAAAISALPPLNGFASEWLIFQALLGGAGIARPEVAAFMPISVAILALTSGLAAACFVKAFGITFLAIPRSPEAEHAREAPRSMQLGMAPLALACVVLGLVPFLVVPALGIVLAELGSPPPPEVAFTLAVPVGVAGTVGTMSPLLVGVLLALVAGVSVLALRMLADRRLRVGETWGCGRISQTPRMEYTAAAFAQPLRRVFAELYRPTEDLSVDFHPQSRYFVQSIQYRSEVHPWFEKALYEPTLGIFRWVAARVRRLQAGSLHLYLLYLMGTLLVLLVAGRWLR